MSNHVKEELRALLPLITGMLIIAVIGYVLDTQFHPKVYSLPLIGLGLSLLLSSWFGKKLLFFTLGIALSTPVFTLAFNWSTIFS